MPFTGLRSTSGRRQPFKICSGYRHHRTYLQGLPISYAMDGRAFRPAQNSSKSEARFITGGDRGSSAQPRHSRGNHNEQVLARTCRCHVGGSFLVGGATCRSALLGLCCWYRRRCRSCRRRCCRQCHSQYLRPGLRCAARLRGLPELCGCGASGMPRRLLGASASGI
jgi:hypothetical protein